MKTVIATLRSVAPYSQSKHYAKDKLQGESEDDHYRRTWRSHMHANEHGECYIPPGAFKNCMSEAAQFMAIGIPGGGKANYTKHFQAGVMVVKPLMLGVAREKVECECLFLPSDGRRGGSKRVDKYYPYFPAWEGEVEFIVVDETVMQTSAADKSMTVFERVLIGAGQYIGIGRFRPRNNGWYGRFRIEGLRVVEGA